MRWQAITHFVLFALACHKAPPAPEATVQMFLAAVAEHRAEDAWNTLSAPSQDALRRRHRALAEATGLTPSNDPAQILFEELALSAGEPPEHINVVSPLGGVVTVRVTSAGEKAAEIRLVRENGVWKIDLAGSLEPE